MNPQVNALMAKKERHWQECNCRRGDIVLAMIYHPDWLQGFAWMCSVAFLIHSF